MNLDDQHLMSSLWEIRGGIENEYARGIAYGYALGLTRCYQVQAMIRLMDLLSNASSYGREEIKSRRAQRD